MALFRGKNRVSLFQTKKGKQKKKKNKSWNRNNNIQPQNKTKQKNRSKPTPKRKTITRHKNTQTFQTQINKKKPPHKTQTTGKTNMFNTLATLPDKKHNDIKAWKKKNKQKTPFAMFKNHPLCFIKFLFFCLHTVFVLQLLCFSENTIKRVFSKKTQLFKNKINKTHFFTHVKKNPQKMSFWVLGNFHWNQHFYSVSWFTLFGAQKTFGPKQIVCTKMRVLFLPSFLTQIVSGNFSKKNPFLGFFSLLDDHLKKHYFYRVLFFFHFSCFVSITPT